MAAYCLVQDRWAGCAPPARTRRVRALAARLDTDGAVDVRVFRDHVSQNALGADVGAGAGFGAGYDRTEEARELLAAWSLRAGGRLQEREDCAPA